MWTNTSPYTVEHPLWYMFEFRHRPRFTPVQSSARADFIAKFWANKYRRTVYVYCGMWGYRIINPDKKAQS